MPLKSRRLREFHAARQGDDGTQGGGGASVPNSLKANAIRTTPRVLPWRRSGVLALAVALFVAVTALRFAVDDQSTAVNMFYLLPVVLLAMEFGFRGGALGAVAGMALVVTWALVLQVDTGAGELAMRCALLGVLGACFGLLGDRLSEAVSDRALVAEQTRYMEGLTLHGLLRLDRSGFITGWNRGATELLGFSEAEALGQPLALIFDGDEYAETLSREILDGAVARGLWDREQSVYAKAGERRWASVSATPLVGGGDAGFALVLRDLTATKTARDASSRMWEVSVEMLATARLDGYFQQLNPRWEEILGWSIEELLSRPFNEFVHPDDKERTTVESARLAEGHETISFENRYRCRDGSYRWLLWNAKTSSEDDLIYAAARDITERKQQEAALEATEAQLRTLSQELEVRVEWRTRELAAANEELEAFSYSVSHDLRAPLRAIDGFSHAIIEDHAGSLPEEVQSDLARVRAASQRMSTMIDEMLALSRVTRQDLVSEPVDLTALAGEVTDELRQAYTDHDVGVEIEQRLDVTGDPGLLRMVLHNLLENAWKFTSHTDDAQVALTRVGSENGHSTFAVRDNGAGFDMRYAEKLFRPFERLHRQDEYSGTGVGLTTVARILSRHGGQIWAEGTPGEGAAFYFVLPTGKARDA